MRTKFCVVYVTAPTGKSAERLAKIVLQRRWAACVNIVPLVKSRYWWKGKIESAKEALLIIKTRESLVSKLSDGVRKIHPYNVPEVIALPILKGHQPYLAWLFDETRA
jgi:periplasmic divalent cation tolerance protein